ncbi:unnamed protein product [Rhizoctonia solani]|uniref:Transmembrane protein n=1 Tax=Rhizoctonia solani TaxID=456999 RepID=A0A8H3CMQ2_9AGAM|nr:unnamed protein product [Rhizoctonia solani]
MVVVSPPMSTNATFATARRCSVLAFCFARRTTGESFFSWQTWSSMSWPRLCVLLVFLDSWLFLFSTGILIGGVGMSSTFINCALGIYACILLYAGSKILIYWFLIEKVHVVWGGTHQPRLRSKVYWGCLLTMAPYAVIVILMFIGRVAYFRDDRACIIGLQKYASLSLLIYDLYINIFLTGMFLWPLFRSRLSNPKIKKMALRTLVAAFAALTTSTINIAVLTIMHGQQLGWTTPPRAVPRIRDQGIKSPGYIAQDQVSTIRRTGNVTEPVVFGKPPGRRSKSLISKIGDVLKSKKDDERDDRRHQMSVQVTITTEQQGDIMMNDVKYVPRSESINESIGTSRMDLEKGEIDEEERRNVVELPGHGKRV